MIFYRLLTSKTWVNKNQPLVRLNPILSSPRMTLTLFKFSKKGIRNHQGQRKVANSSVFGKSFAWITIFDILEIHNKENTG